MTLEVIKSYVMQQASEKGFGTIPTEINVPEKLILIGTEIDEALKDRDKIKGRLDEALEFWQSPPHHPKEPSWSTLLFLPNSDRLRRYSGSIKDHYAEEMGDLLQRVLHLGGCFGIVFPEPDRTTVSINDFLQVYRLISSTYEHYRKMRGEPSREQGFREGVLLLAHYCLAIAESEGLDLEKAVLQKISSNRTREWKKEDYNERLH